MSGLFVFGDGMVDARSIATLGIGFGVVAVVTLGLCPAIDQPQLLLPDQYGASRLEWVDHARFTEQDLAVVQFVISFVLQEG